MNASIEYCNRCYNRKTVDAITVLILEDFIVCRLNPETGLTLREGDQGHLTQPDDTKAGKITTKHLKLSTILN